MARPAILFENDFALGTLTSRAAAAGYPCSNTTDWRSGGPYRWRGESGETTGDEWLKVDAGLGSTYQPECCIVAGHNLYTLGWRWKPQYSDNDIAWSDAASYLTPTSNAPSVALWNATSIGAHRYWRAYLQHPTLTVGGQLQLGIATLGRLMTIPAGMPDGTDILGEEAVTDWASSPGGAWLGANHRYVKRDFELAYDIGMTTTEFYSPASGLRFDEDFLPHARSKPFWFLWNTDVSQQTAWLCAVNGKISMPFHGIYTRRKLSLPIRALQTP